MKSAMQHTSPKPRRTWLIPAIFAAVLFLGGIVSDLVASDLEQRLAPYRLWIYLAAGLALIVAVASAVRESRRHHDSLSPNNDSFLSNDRNVLIGGSVTNSNIVTGDRNIVVERHEGDIVQQKSVHEAAAVGVTSLHQLPSPPRDFTGRDDELNELLNKLESGGVSISGLQGQGGIGKTALALKLAEQIRSHYPDAQFYLDLKGTSREPIPPATAMAHVIRAYNPTAQLPEAEAELQGLYRSVLDGKRALLLMDNAADDKQAEPLIPPSNCVLLITSRTHFHLPGLYAKDLAMLSERDSRELLLKICPRISGEAAEIARLCGYLPLALRLAAGTLAEREEISPADYMRRLKDALQRLKMLDGVEASLEVSYELLSEEQRQLWRTLAVFPDTFDVQAAAAVWDLERESAQDALSGLKARSLVDWDRDTDRYRLHDLTRLFADSRLCEQERVETSGRHSAYFQKVLLAADVLFERGGDGMQQGLALYDLERLNIEAGQSWAENQYQADEDAARWCVSYALRGAYVMGLRQHPRELIRWLEAALSAAQHLNDRPSEGAALCNLGIAYRNVGDARAAIDYYEQALAIDHEIGNRWSEGRTLGNLGLAYYDLGDTHKAIGYYEQHLAITQEIGDRRGEGYTLGNLGLAYSELGDANKAIETHKQALVIHRKLGERRGEGRVLNNIGLAYSDLGDTHKAIEYYEQALAIARKIGDRKGEGAALGYLGFVYFSLGEVQKAIEHNEQRLLIAREIGDRRSEGDALWGLSLALYTLSQRDLAIAHAQEALKLLEQIEDPNADKVREQLDEWLKEQ